MNLFRSMFRFLRSSPKPIELPADLVKLLQPELKPSIPEPIPPASLYLGRKVALVCGTEIIDPVVVEGIVRNQKTGEVTVSLSSADRQFEAPLSAVMPTQSPVTIPDEVLSFQLIQGNPELRKMYEKLIDAAAQASSSIDEPTLQITLKDSPKAEPLFGGLI